MPICQNRCKHTTIKGKLCDNPCIGELCKRHNPKAKKRISEYTKSYYAREEVKKRYRDQYLARKSQNN